MGLDMYVNKTKLISYYEKGKIFIDGIEIKGENVNEIVFESMYWRKANAIHKWFVDNIQDGVDDCEKYIINEDNLQVLLEIVDYLIKNIKFEDDNIKNYEICEEALPTKSGFFFGETDYDIYYYNDLVDTKEWIEKVLINKEMDEYWFHYCSSW